MKLSTRSRYGTRILADLANYYNQGPVQVGDISKRQNISVKYVEQLIRPLKKAELIISVRGPKGGHILAHRPDKITLGQVVRLFEFQNIQDDCLCGLSDCVLKDECILRVAWQKAIIAFYDKLDTTSIADLELECCEQAV